MENKIDKYYLIYETCMKLKKRGFDVWCDKFYAPYPHHNGEPLGSDEEYELRAEGRGNEITSKIIMQTWTERNSMLVNNDSCSCPEINTVVDWIFENWNTILTVKPYYTENGLTWFCEVYYVKDNSIQLMKTLLPYNHKYKAYADGIRWVLDNYKVI